MDTALKVQFYPMWCGQCFLLPGFGLFGSFVSQSARWISWRLFGDSVYRSIASADGKGPNPPPKFFLGFGLKIDADNKIEKERSSQVRHSIMMAMLVQSYLLDD
jgi:hypothetical protein